MSKGQGGYYTPISNVEFGNVVVKNILVIFIQHSIWNFQWNTSVKKKVWITSIDQLVEHLTCWDRGPGFDTNLDQFYFIVSKIPEFLSFHYLNSDL